MLYASSEAYGLFDKFAKLTPELRWYCHGHANQTPYWRSNVTTTAELSKQMRASRVGIHFKEWSDGYGHVLHNLFAIGKPVVATASYYVDKLGGPLFVDGVTSFNVQTRTDDEVVQIIRRLAQDDQFHQQISENVYKRFKQIVDFDYDAQQVKEMLAKVL